MHSIFSSISNSRIHYMMSFINIKIVFHDVCFMDAVDSVNLECLVIEEYEVDNSSI